MTDEPTSGVLPGPVDARPNFAASGGLSEGTLLGGRLRFLQPVRGYRAAIDPVLLAAAVPPGGGGRVLDVGVGTGAASLCLASRDPGCSILGIDPDETALEIARRNVALNGLDGRIGVRRGRIEDAGGLGSFDRVMTNPPYQDPGGGPAPADPGRRAAHLGDGGLAGWIGACLARLAPGGTFAIVHRAERLGRIVASFEGVAGGVTVVPYWPRVGVDAKRVVVLARKGSRSPLRLTAGLVLHEADGHFTPGAEAILRDGAAFPS